MNAPHDLPTAYDPQAIEQKWYTLWETSGYFKPTLDKEKSFSIALPPPNVTGSLHMGHGFNNAIMDALTRYYRMQGYNTLWQPGTDHAGIATQMVVERQLAAAGQDRRDLGRQAFVDKVWQWKAQSGGTITKQIRRLGSSVDWSRERFTMDEDLSCVVKEVFVRLHEEGLIYRGKRLVNWDPKLQTALSDLEVESHEEKGSLWRFRYFFADADCRVLGKNYLVVATTRPETLLGDVAVAVHPDDERYKDLVGKEVVLPITGRKIPIVADAYVEKDFGTGCVKITPAHDFNDYELGKRHNLPLIGVFDLKANVLARFERYRGEVADTLEAPADFVGLDRYAARKLVVELAERDAWLEGIDDHTLKTPKGDRSGVVVEPLLTDQWYVKIDPLAKAAIAAVEDGRIRFVPEQYTNMYMAWMRDVQDWCISRQLWWGHRIPAWYDDKGQVYVARSEDEARQKYGLGDIALRQDEDVLDTWFSSALWTFSTLGWTGDQKTDTANATLRAFHPTSVLVTGFDIIFFWVARMIMMTMHFVKDENGDPQVPFKTVYVHGLVRDGEGQKMSKSKGNVLDPLDLIDGIDLEALVKKRTTGLMNPKDAQKIEKATRKEFPNGISAYGTDAVRFSFCAQASTGRDIKFDLKRVEGYRNFCNKIWNATRFALMNVEGKSVAKSADPALWGLPEKWIASRLQKTKQAVALAFETYRLDLASAAIYDFIWNAYCDWYVELAKPTLNGSASEEQKAQTRFALLATLEEALRLAHPLIPFITEELWRIVAPLVGRQGETIMLAPYPTADAERIDERAESDMQWLQDLIGAVRTIRGEMNLGNARLLPVLLQNISPSEKSVVERIEPLFLALAKVQSIAYLEAGQSAPLASSSVVGGVSVLVPMKDLIDPKAELLRLQKERDKATIAREKIAGKLANAAFVNNAPPPVVEGEREKLAQLDRQLSKIDQSLAQIQAL